MFELDDLKSYIGSKMRINGTMYTLELHDDLSGELAVWSNDSYRIYATPMFDDVSVPVYIVDVNGQETGDACSYVAVDTYEHYCEVVKELAEQILRMPRM